MRTASPRSRPAPVRSRTTSLAAVVVLAAAVLSGCAAPYSSTSHAYSSATSYPSGSTHPTLAEQAATLQATLRYRGSLLAASTGLLAQLAAISAASSQRNRTAAERAELGAQGDFDVIRAEIAPSSATAQQLDGERWGTSSGGAEGLHAVEEALWHRDDLSAAGSLAHGIEPLALGAAIVLGRANLTPQQILSHAQALLSWAVEVPVSGREEQFSRLDLVDVAATAGAVRRAFLAVAPLGRLVDPGVTSLTGSRVAALDGALASLGSPATRSDATVPAASWRVLATDLDGLDAEMGVLDGLVAGYGSGRLYP